LNDPSIVVPPMEPTIVDPRAGLREQGSIRVLGRGNRHIEMYVSTGASHHIGYDAMQTDDFGLRWAQAG
jgi:hypothetical protein